MDWISQLPKIILHEILSRMPKKDAARTSVLSKAWRETWRTFPILIFSEAEYGIWDRPVDRTNMQQMEELREKRNNFYNCVERTLLRFHNLGLAIKQIKLSMSFYDVKYLSPLVDQWISLAVTSGVEVLDLFLCGTVLASYDKHYCLPASVNKAKSLIKLVLTGRFLLDQAFLNHPIRFSSLRALSLSRVNLGDEKVSQKVIKNLIASCPLIESLTLKHCTVIEIGNPNGQLYCELRSISIGGLPKLKEVEIMGIQEVIVDAPSLEIFIYCPSIVSMVPCAMSFDHCRNLRMLHLSCLATTIITDQYLLAIFTKFPHLENLKFSRCPMSERINLSCIRLKVLEISDCSNLNEVEIEAPNLHKCRYTGDGNKMPIMSFLNSSSQMEADVVLRINSYRDCQKLREFLQSFNPRKAMASLTLYINQPTGDFNPDELVSAPPPTIKHLILQLRSGIENLCLPFWSCLLRSFCPSTICVKWDSMLGCKTLIQLLCEKRQSREEAECHCISSDIKCWWHDLKDVKIASSCKTEKNALDCKTLLNALPTLKKRQDLTFWLEFENN